MNRANSKEETLNLRTRLNRVMSWTLADVKGRGPPDCQTRLASPASTAGLRLRERAASLSARLTMSADAPLDCEALAGTSSAPE